MEHYDYHEKATDKIQHHFMIQISIKIEIEGNFFNLIKHIYKKNPTKKHHTYGYYTENFPRLGMRHGSPLYHFYSTLCWWFSQFSNKKKKSQKINYMQMSRQSSGWGWKGQDGGRRRKLKWSSTLNCKALYFKFASQASLILPTNP